jgi:hypothetical protein
MLALVRYKTAIIFVDVWIYQLSLCNYYGMCSMYIFYYKKLKIVT